MRSVTISYRFGDFYLDRARRVLKRNGEPVPLTPRAFDTLVALVSRGGEVAEKDELLREVWADAFVEEATLVQNVFTLRRVLGQDENQQYIATVPKHGYRFVADVIEVETPTLVVEKVTRTRIVTEEESEDAPLTHVRYEGGEGRALMPGILKPSAVLGVLKRHWLTSFVVALILVVVTGMFILRISRRGSKPDLASSLQRLRITRLTNSGKVTRATISPDGKYVAYSQLDRDGQSLWIMQSTATNNIEIVPRAAAAYQGIAFSPNATALYYTVYENGSPLGVLYRVPVLGGVPKKILSNLESNISFSPDGKRFAFIRWVPEKGGSQIFLANSDGTEVRELIKRLPSGSLVGDGPAWSPDGNTIICPFKTVGPNRTYQNLIAVQVETGSASVLTDRQWDWIGQVVWLPDGSGLLIDASGQTVASLSTQIWDVSYPRGGVRLITNDLNSYRDLGIAADAKTISTVLSDRVANFWIVTNGGETAKQITTGAGDRLGEMMGMSWTPDNKIVYGSTAGDQVAIWAMNADGSNQTDLTPDSQISFKPAVSPDGTIIFTSRRTGAPDLWKMDANGGNPLQLTTGMNGTFPAVSSDGKSVVFVSMHENRLSVWRLPSTGGKPIQVIDKAAVWPSISPDGKLIACYYAEPAAPAKIGIFPIDGGEPIRSFSVPSSAFIDTGVRWTPDGLSVAYVDNQNGVSNIWSQPMNGGSPKQLTHFDSDQIFRFAWSLDGKQLAVERGFNVSDVILITNAISGS